MAERHCTCAHCGAEFVTVHRSKIYCSRSCNHAAFVARTPDRVREYRDKEVAKRKSEIAESPKFTSVWLNECAECLRKFYWISPCKKFCCTSCSQQNRKRKYLSSADAAVRVIKKCLTCGSEFVTKRITGVCCSAACYKKKNRKNNNKPSNARKRARLFGVEYEPVNPTKVFERDGWRCQICGKQTPNSRRGTRYSNAPELDHRVPISKGGPHTYGNTQCTCRACNGSKSNLSSVGQMPLLC